MLYYNKYGMERGTRVKPPRAFIFDMDGTLTDSMEGWSHFGLIAAAYYHLENPQYFQEHTYHRPVEQVLDFLKSEYALDFTPEQFWAWLMEAMDRYYETVQLKPQVLSTMERLYKNGYPLCVATATHRTSAVRVLERLGLTQYFQFLLSCHDTGIGKQQPDIYHRCAKRLQLLPDEIVVVEDRLDSVLTALRAGYQVAGIYDRHEEAQGRQPFLREQAHFWLDNMGEIYGKILPGRSD